MYFPNGFATLFDIPVLVHALASLIGPVKGIELLHPRTRCYN